MNISLIHSGSYEYLFYKFVEHISTLLKMMYAKSAITYIACIANKIKSSVEPWNSINKLNQDKLIKQMESKIDKYILNDVNIIERFNKKKKYLQFKSEDDSLLESDIQNLTYFYPPLSGFEIKGLVNISDTFKSNLKSNIKSGSYYQQEQILSIKSKLIFYGLSIQEKIQKIINKKAPLLTNNALEPFLENACCHTDYTNVHQYFIDIDKTLIIDNNIMIDLDNILYDLNSQIKAPLYYDYIDRSSHAEETNIYFSQDTIYRAFIIFCNNKSLINDDLREICQINSQNINNKQTIDEQIDRLKSEGINYNQELLDKLLTVINLKNSVHINLNIIPQNPIQILDNILTTIESTEQEILIPKEFTKHFKNILDTFELKSTKENQQVRVFRNYLAVSNDKYLLKIETFMKKNSQLSKNQLKQFIENITNITNFLETGDNIYIDSKDETIYKMQNFIKNSIDNLINIFPNIILNKINKSSIPILKHWKLSQKHTMDIKEIVNKYYNKLNKFYDVDELIRLLKNIQLKTNNIELLIKHTPFFASFNNGDEDIDYIFDRRLLMLFVVVFNVVDNSFNPSVKDWTSYFMFFIFSSFESILL